MRQEAQRQHASSQSNAGGKYRQKRLRRSVRCWVAFAFLVAAASCAWSSTTLLAPGGKLRVEVETGDNSQETISILSGREWVQALHAAPSPVRVVNRPSVLPIDCRITTAREIPDGLLVQGDCDTGSFKQRMTLTGEPDVLAVQMKFLPRDAAGLVSVEDRYDFAPGRRAADAPDGPVDFVWSQDIKNEKDDVIPNAAFKSPVVMLQQGSVFTALMPRLSDRVVAPLALDLDVTSGKLPWLSFGAMSSRPYGHSYFRRDLNGGPKIIPTAGESGVPQSFVQYSYSIVASDQPDKLGYRRVVRLLWQDEGHRELIDSPDLQQNILRRQLITFADWAKDTWIRYADQVYVSFPCGDRRCGTLASNRNPWGKWDQSAPDAWFNSWFQTLRTAYGWYLYGKQSNDTVIEHKAESVLNLILTSPRDGGAFSTIYLVNDKRWVRSDGWAGYSDDYHAFDMSWTGYWMLRWIEDLDPGRKEEVLRFLRPYGDFLLQHQLASGVIPAWYNRDLVPRQEFRDFNAETAGSAFFLAELSGVTGDRKYLGAAQKAMAFITREVLPRQRWFDFETFLSCARKPYSFYDPWTAQFPQNNLSQTQAAAAWLRIYQITHSLEALKAGTRVLDYLLLTQQVWNNPALSPKMVGGFTTQNTDAEWSDAREAYDAALLWSYYRATGSQEYLERAVAAARSTFAVAPWENWAHTGYMDESGALTGIHWGQGSGMTSVEIMSAAMGDGLIDLQSDAGACLNACSFRDLKIAHTTGQGTVIWFGVTALPAGRTLHLKFAGVQPDQRYQIVENGHTSPWIAGDRLQREGYDLHH